MPFASLYATGSTLPKPSQNRGGVASSSSPSIERALRRPPLLLAARKAKNATSASSVPRASLWDSLFGGGGGDGENGAKENAAKPKQEEEDFVLLDTNSLPPFLPESVLSRTFLSGRDLAISYVASRDGWSALRFHEKCDFKGPSLVVAETTE